MACQAIDASAAAIMTIDVLQEGADVVASFDGQIDTTDLVYVTQISDPTSIAAANAQIIFDENDQLVDVYSKLSGPSSIGPLIRLYPPSYETPGTNFGIQGAGEYVYLPTGYASLDILSGGATWSSITLSALGLTPGTYTYTYGSGADTGTITVQIGPAAVPEPSSLVICGGLGLMAYGFRKRVKKCAPRQAVPSRHDRASPSSGW